MVERAICRVFHEEHGRAGFVDTLQRVNAVLHMREANIREM